MGRQPKKYRSIDFAGITLATYNKTVNPFKAATAVTDQIMIIPLTSSFNSLPAWIINLNVQPTRTDSYLLYHNGKKLKKNSKLSWPWPALKTVSTNFTSSFYKEMYILFNNGKFSKFEISVILQNKKHYLVVQKIFDGQIYLKENQRAIYVKAYQNESKPTKLFAVSDDLRRWLLKSPYYQKLFADIPGRKRTSFPLKRWPSPNSGWSRGIVHFFSVARGRGVIYSPKEEYFDCLYREITLEEIIWPHKKLPKFLLIGEPVLFQLYFAGNMDNGTITKVKSNAKR